MDNEQSAPSTSSFFEHAPAPMFEFDFSQLISYRNALHEQGVTDIEQYLNSHREELRKLIELARMKKANRAVLRLYGAEDTTELHEAMPRVIGEEGISALLKASAAILSGKSYYEIETVNYDLNGNRKTVLLSFSVPPGEEESLRSVLVSATDISDNRQLQQQIAILSLLPETNPNIVLIMDCDEGISYANPAARLWIREQGFSNLEELYRLLPSGFRSSVCGYCDQQEAKQFSTEYNRRKYDLKLKPIIGDRKCMLTLTDVTEFERISREREIYFQAFRSTIHAMVITDTDGIIQYVNPTFEQLYGYSQEEAQGRTPNILNPGRAVYRDAGYEQEDYEELFGGLWKDISDPQKGFWEGMVLNRQRDGNTIWIRLTINAIYDAEGKISHYIGIPINIDERLRRERSIRIDILKTITELAEMRDNETGNHIQRVGVLARMLAEDMGMSAKYCEDIQLFAQHHDIGKVGISDLILLAERKLMEEEFEIMKHHVTLGYQLLAEKPTLEMAAEIAYTHHERYDGTGYPRGLAGKEIPLSGRITAVVDVYDALRSQRPYKESWSHKAARREIVSLQGSHFDPEIIELFARREDDFRRVFEQYQD